MGDEIVVGCGASALTHLYYATQSGFSDLNRWNTTIIGKDDLWGNIAKIDPGHRFGQPNQIVPLGPKHDTPKLDKDNPAVFQTASQIDVKLRGMKKALQEKGVKVIYDQVTEITRVANKIRVKTAGASTFFADRVIVATGFGRSALPKVSLSSEIELALQNAGSYQWKDASGANLMMGGTEYLWKKAQDIPVPASGKFAVAVQGSSATSSWVVLRAMELNKKRGANLNDLQITWIARSGFGDANPAGRNSDVLLAASDNGWLTKAEVKAIGFEESQNCLGVTLAPVAAAARNAETLTSLGEAYRDFYKGVEATKREKAITGNKGFKVVTIDSERPIYVNHFVYALGADPALPGGAGWILSKDLQGELDAVLDTERHFDDDPSATTLGFKTKDEKVWVVGAATFRGAGIERLGDLGKKYSNIAKMMCEAGSPPEGIAAIIAGAKALTGYREPRTVSLNKLNIQTADFRDIERWFGDLYLSRTGKAAPAKTTRIMADQIVALRKHTVFGLSKAEIDDFGNPNNDFWLRMFTEGSSKGAFVIDDIAAVPDSVSKSK